LHLSLQSRQGDLYVWGSKRGVFQCSPKQTRGGRIYLWIRTSREQRQKGIEIRNIRDRDPVWNYATPPPIQYLPLYILRRGKISQRHKSSSKKVRASVFSAADAKDADQFDSIFILTNRFSMRARQTLAKLCWKLDNLKCQY
jgi:hypothetical protein